MPIRSFQNNHLNKSGLLAMQTFQLSMAAVLNLNFCLKFGYYTHDKSKNNRSDFRLIFLKSLKDQLTGLIWGGNVPLTEFRFKHFDKWVATQYFVPDLTKSLELETNLAKMLKPVMASGKWKLLQDLTLLVVHLRISHWCIVVLWD